VAEGPRGTSAAGPARRSGRRGLRTATDLAAAAAEVAADRGVADTGSSAGTRLF
jgi:hypothetical protein